MDEKQLIKSLGLGLDWSCLGSAYLSAVCGKRLSAVAMLSLVEITGPSDPTPY